MFRITTPAEAKYANKAFGIIHQQKQLLLLINAGLEGAPPAVGDELVETRFEALLGEGFSGSPSGYEFARCRQENALLRITVLELASQLAAQRILPASSAFDEARYANENADVAVVVQKSWQYSGFLHWLLHGLKEGREGAALRPDAPTIEAASRTFLDAYNHAFRGWWTKLNRTTLKRLVMKLVR